jgi:hypothetical protein
MFEMDCEQDQMSLAAELMGVDHRDLQVEVAALL